MIQCQYFSPGVPNWMQFSNVRTKSESLSFMTCRLLDFSMFFSHLFAWPWGSIIKGHLLALLQRNNISKTFCPRQIIFILCNTEIKHSFKISTLYYHFHYAKLFPKCSLVIAFQVINSRISKKFSKIFSSATVINRGW